MAEEDNGRSMSPYHQKCFPPFCDSAGQMDKQAVSKMNRSDLEDRYIVYADENLALKRSIRDHERHVQRLQTAMARQDSADKKGGAKVPTSMHYDSARVDNLESQNKNLQAKVKVLKQQLMNHSYIHSKENRIAENKEKLQKRDSFSPDHSFRDVGQTQSARESKHRSNKDDSALKERIAVLEQSLETQKEKYKARIAKLEKELAALANKSHTTLNEELDENSRKVNDNVEMIRLRRLSQEQATQISSLTEQYEAIEKELAELQKSLKLATENTEELQRQLELERERTREAQSHVTKSVSQAETIRALDEQVRDLQTERRALKEINEKLLLLTSGHQAKSERSLQAHSESKTDLSTHDSISRKQSKSITDLSTHDDVSRKQSKSITDLSTHDDVSRKHSKSNTDLSTHDGISRTHSKSKTDLSTHDGTSRVKFRMSQNEPSVTSKSVTDIKSMSQSQKDRLEENEELQYQVDLVSPAKSQCSSKHTTAENLDYAEVKAQLCNALIENQKLKLALEQCENGIKSRPHSVAPSRTVSEHNTTPVTSESDWGKTPPPSLKTSSSHQVREVQQVPVSEPAQKPVLIIVSKHEFDAVLLKKKKYYSETEVALPTHGQQDLSCKLEICVYDLEMNNQMMDYLSNKNEGDPHVFVTWNFVGLEQRTVSMPADQAHFHTNVTYFGPLSDNLTTNVKERDMPIYLMLEMSDGRAAKVGEGHLDLSPAIQHPGRSYMRCVNLSGDGGSANVYCSFKLHECCQSDAPAGFMLEVGIGHLRLKNSDIPSNPQATHLYVEYLLLGHCGEELETDSVPKSEVMRFNHTKRMRITDQNCVHLQPYLQKDDTKSLRFNVLAEPCSLANDSEVNEVGYADLNLLEEMVHKNQDVISAQVPVLDSDGQYLGSLSVTVIGIDTLHNYAENQGS